jgi:hypothetical protein
MRNTTAENARSKAPATLWSLSEESPQRLRTTGIASTKAARGPFAGLSGVAYRITIHANDTSEARITASFGMVSRFIY